MSDWIEWKWTKEKPYPETLETMFSHIRYASGEETANFLSVKEWYANGGGNFQNNGGRSQITHYKLA